METLTSTVNENARKFSRILEIIAKNDNDKTRLITILQEVQEEYRYLPQEVLTYIATALNIPVAEVYGIATFYNHFSLEAKGKYVIKVCDGTACHVKGSGKIIDSICKNLHLHGDKHTTDNLLFTLEAVSCVGACGIAPVVVINEKVYGEVDSKKCIETIEEIKKTEL